MSEAADHNLEERRLPLALSPAMLEGNSSLSTGRAARILVVDDQPANIQVVGLALGKLGYEITPALDGSTALKRLALRAADLILLDLLMPDMDGCEVCRRLRQNPEWRDLPVLFLSAADDKDLVVRALEAGGTDYITKPFNQAELILRVKTQLDLKSARDRLKQLAEDKDELRGHAGARFEEPTGRDADELANPASAHPAHGGRAGGQAFGRHSPFGRPTARLCE